MFPNRHWRIEDDEHVLEIEKYPMVMEEILRLVPDPEYPEYYICYSNVDSGDWLLNSRIVASNLENEKRILEEWFSDYLKDEIIYLSKLLALWDEELEDTENDL